MSKERHIKTGVGAFRKGKCYRFKDDPKMVKKVHSKPRDINGFQYLLVNIRLPSDASRKAYNVTLALVQTLNPEAWQEIPEELFDRTVSGLLDERLSTGMKMELKEVSEETLKQMSEELDEDLEMKVVEIGNKKTDEDS
jgi:hypothetical protein